MNASPANEKTLWIVWSALLMSHLVLTGVGFYTHGTRDAIPVELPLFWPLSVAAVCTGLGSLFVNLVLNHSDKIQAGASQLKGQGESFEKAFSLLLLQFQQKMILGSALAESVTIFGFVLFYLGQIPPRDFLIFVGAGITLHFIGYPKVGTLRQALQTEYGKHGR